MQLHGQKKPIHVDPSIAEAAESSNTMFVNDQTTNIIGYLGGNGKEIQKY